MIDSANTSVTSNPATQTLFRFVSLRNPILTKKEGNTKFIFRGEENRGIFDDLLETWTPALKKSKIDFLTEKIRDNAPGINNIRKTQKEIEDHFGVYYYSKLLTEQGFLSSGDVEIVKNGTIDKPLLWDSLIYQVLTQKDFYIKEILVQILQTIHYAQYYSYFSSETNIKKREAKQKEIALAKVVIPEHLFLESVSENQIISKNFSELVSNDVTDSLIKNQKAALAVYEKGQIENLKKELSKAHQVYRRQYSEGYDLANKDYQSLTKPLYDAYDQEILQVEATFEKDMTTAAKQLALSNVAKPELPNFQFEFRKERDLSFLQSKLSQSSLRSLSMLIGEYAENDTIVEKLSNRDIIPENILEIGEQKFILPEDEKLSFEEIFETISAKLSDLNDDIYQNTEIEKQKYVSVGGVLIPIDKSALAPYNYSFFANSFGVGLSNFGWNFNLVLSLPDSLLKICSLTYQLETSSGLTKTESAFTYTKDNSTVSILGFFPKGFIIPKEDFITKVIFNINFADGKNTDIVIENQIFSNNNYSGIFKVSGENHKTEYDAANTNSFIPSGFGVKRLGIADYLKVEQSTHAYVEGEVANIENIMAREYREKSTRRLRRSETTDTTSSDTEREQLTDTTVATRFEMQSEVAKILQETTNIEAHTSFGYGGLGDKIHFEVGGSYANNRSKEESTRQAMTQAQDVTSKALDRVVTKVHQERIEKIVEEFEENNSHGFDNRKGDKHIIGVYRWVDKLMKNQIWNYGKRLMFEFVVPEPSKLHTLAIQSTKNKQLIEKPIDPRREEGNFNLRDYSKITDESIKYWTNIYNFEIDVEPVQKITISHSFSDKNQGSDDEGTGRWAGVYSNNDFKIPEGYLATRIKGTLNIGAGTIKKGTTNPSAYLYICGQVSTGKVDVVLDSIKNQITISSATWDIKAISGSLVATCQLSEDVRKKWQQQTFNVIIRAYEDAMEEYNEKIAEEEAKANNIKGSNPNFYRQIEQEVLKHNCIAYLTNDSSQNNKLGTVNYDGDKMDTFELDRTNLDQYASLAKFMEQAFEWEIMSYKLYPYYWGKRKDWDKLYISEDIDPLFRSFLRSGMARIVVTVRPGFEDAVQFYMATGKLWNGGEVPVIGNPLYLSIVDELKDLKGEAQGKSWITRIPTSLTILQAQNIGLQVQHALPFTTEDPLDFENPNDVITESNFKMSDATMNGEDNSIKENNITATRNLENYNSIRGIVNSITDASSRNIYKILIPKGEWFESDLTGKPFVELIGEDSSETILYCDGNSTKLSPADYSMSAYANQPLNTIPQDLKHCFNVQHDIIVRNLTVKVDHCKYDVHFEDNDWKNSLFEKVRFMAGANTNHCVGKGMRENQKSYFADCEFIATQPGQCGFYIHNWNNRTAPWLVSVSNSYFNNCDYLLSTELGSEQNDMIELLNCHSSRQNSAIIVGVESNQGITYWTNANGIKETNPLNVPYSVKLNITGTNVSRFDYIPYPGLSGNPRPNIGNSIKGIFNGF